MKIKFAAVALSLGIVALSGCSTSSNVSKSTNSYADKFYTDATQVLTILNNDLSSNKTSYTDDQLKQINKFIDKYSDISPKSDLFSPYMTTIGQLQQFSNLDIYKSIDDSTSSDNTNTDSNSVYDTSEQDTSKSDPALGMTEDQVLNSSWGTPIDKTETKDTFGTSALWIYDDGKSVFFVDGKVNSITQ